MWPGIEIAGDLIIPNRKGMGGDEMKEFAGPHHRIVDCDVENRKLFKTIYSNWSVPVSDLFCELS